jgi:hypothetical protein
MVRCVEHQINQEGCPSYHGHLRLSDYMRKEKPSRLAGTDTQGENDMGFFSELHAQIYYEPRWESDYYREAREEWNKELREIEDRIAQADCEARPIDFNEKTMLVKAKCRRAAQRLSEERKRAAADEVLRHNQRRRPSEGCGWSDIRSRRDRNSGRHPIKEKSDSRGQIPLSEILETNWEQSATR